MINLIDNLLNRITMYRLVLYYLMILLAAAIAFGAIGLLPYKPLDIFFSMLVLLAVCWIANIIFADAFRAQANTESVYITAFILTLIITPASPLALSSVPFLIWAGIWAMASKYIFALNKKHFFNPAAFAVALTALTIGSSASWWVGGNIPLLPIVLIGGLLIVRKIQRFDLVLTFLGAAILSTIATSATRDPLSTFQILALRTPIFYFATIMLTEPLTTPPTRRLRMLYAAVVGLLYAPTIHIGSLHSTPELALLAGNLFSYAISPKKKYALALTEKNPVSADIYDFAFAGAGAMKFKPGQYMEWTLAHPHSDGRGNRRYFTIASSPTENEVRLGVKFYENASSFKKALLAMDLGQEIVGGQLAGDFTLPKDAGKKLAFIAGGIGITPFRSMVKYLSDSNEARDIVLLYSNRTFDEIAYKDIFDEAEKKFGTKTIYAITDANGLPLQRSIDAQRVYLGRIDATLIQQEIPDYRERIFYISGTHAMTGAFKKTLAELGVPRANIKTDFFPGFA